MAADEVINFDWDELGEVERGEAVLETLEALFDRVDRHIELTSRQDASNPHVVDYLMQSCLGFVDMIYTGRENTCVDHEAFYENSWEVDHEPVAVPLDMWARGAVVVKEKPKLPGANRTGGSSVISRASSIKARKSAPPGIAEEADKSRLKNRTPSPPSPNKKPPKAKLTRDELDREDRLREELAMRRRRDEINRQMVAAEKRALDDVAELKKSLKGKDYSYDHRGQVVIMTKVDGERMPGMLVTPGTAVADAPPPVTPSEGRVQSSQGAQRRPKVSEGSKRGSSGDDQSVSKPSVDGDDKKGRSGKMFADTLSMPYVEQPNEGQPPPTETIKPTDGVTLQFGRSTKKGAERRTNGLQDMSKGEYLEYIKKKGSYEKLPFNEAAEFKAKQMQDQKKKERERQQRIRREAAEASGEEYSRRMSTSSVDSGIGPLGLGVPTADTNHPSWMKDGVKVDPQPPKPRTKRRGDVNKTMILASDDWGQNKPQKKGEENEPDPSSPGKRPSRMHATIEHRERTVGRVPRRPRDRSFGYITERDLQEYLPQGE